MPTLLVMGHTLSSKEMCSVELSCCDCHYNLSTFFFWSCSLVLFPFPQSTAIFLILSTSTVTSEKKIGTHFYQVWHNIVSISTSLGAQCFALVQALGTHRRLGPYPQRNKKTISNYSSVIIYWVPSIDILRMRELTGKTKTIETLLTFLSLSFLRCGIWILTHISKIYFMVKWNKFKVPSNH